MEIKMSVEAASEMQHEFLASLELKSRPICLWCARFESETGRHSKCQRPPGIITHRFIGGVKVHDFWEMLDGRNAVKESRRNDDL
jgi:hypothetical protein